MPPKAEMVESFTMDTPTEYLGPGEAAILLRVSPKTLGRWADQGRVPCAVTLGGDHGGGHRRFRRDVIEKIATEMGLE